MTDSADSPRFDSSSSGGHPRRHKAKTPAGASSPSGQGAFARLLEAFVVCGRCGFFLAGYRALAGLETLQQAAVEAADNWVTLPWNERAPALLEKSYGFYIFSDVIHQQERCEECGRVVLCEWPGVASADEGALHSDEAAQAEAPNDAATAEVATPLLRVQIIPAGRR